MKSKKMIEASTSEILLHVVLRHRVVLLVGALACTWTWILVTNIGRGW